MYSLIKYAFAELVGSFLLTLLYGSMYLYNIGYGLGVADPTTGVYPVWAQALLVALGTWMIYFIGSKVSHRHVELNPIVTAVFYSQRAGEKRVFLQPLIRSILMWTAQMIGSLCGTLVIYLLGNFELGNVTQHITPTLDGASSDSLTPTGTQLARVFVLESLGTVALVIVAYYGKNNTTPSPTRKCNYNVYGKYMATLAGLYMLVAWLHTRLSLDPLRAGWFCIFGSGSDSNTSNCSNVSDGWFEASLFLFITLIQALLVGISSVAIYNSHAKPKRNQ